MVATDCLNSEKSQDVEAMAQAMALLYYCLADEFVARYGPEAKEHIKKAVTRFGEMRGQHIRKRCDEAGLEPNVDSLASCYDLPLAKAWEMVSAREPGTRRTQISRCPLACVWKDLGAPDLGRLYCEVDPALVRGFSPKMTFRCEKNVLEGDPECLLVYSDEPLPGQ